MKKRSIFIAIALAVVFTVALATGCKRESRQREEGEPITVKMASVLAESHHVGQGLNKFAEIVEQKREGTFTVEVYHGGQLGSGKETYESTQSGFIEMASDSYANLYTLTPAFEVYHLPFFFHTREQQLKAFANPKIRSMADDLLDDIGLKWLLFFELAPRQIATSRKKVETFSDLRGLKFRASRSPLEIESHKAWGATGITIDWPEVPEALRLGMVDGETVGYDSIWAALHHVDSVKYIGAINFQAYGNIVVVSKKWWDALSSEERQLLEESAKEAEVWHQNFIVESINRAKREIRDAGTEIYTVSPELYRELEKRSRETVWKKFVGSSVIPQDYFDRISREIGEVDPAVDGIWYK